MSEGFIWGLEFLLEDPIIEGRVLLIKFEADLNCYPCLFFSFIHMCIQCLSHFSPLPPSPPPLLPPQPLATRQKLFCPYL
jgi:hypothetical protein